MPAHLRALDATAWSPLLRSLGVGRTLVTLAPEVTSPSVIRELADAGVVVAAGHTNATYAARSRPPRHGPARRHAPVQRDVAAARIASRAPSARR